MLITATEAETQALLSCANAMCLAARTAPKTKGEDLIRTAVLTGTELSRLADKTEQLADELAYGFFKRDAENLRQSGAVVLIGVIAKRRGLMDGCGYCGFKNCTDCAEEGGACAFGPIDLGIAVGSAVSVAADRRVDNRVMFSIGRAAAAMGLPGDNAETVLAILLSASGKSPYFDRK